MTTLTFAFHAFIFLWLKDISFVTYSYAKPDQSLLAEDNLDLSSDSMQKRNQDLEHIFSRLMAKNVIPTDVKFDCTDLDPDLIPQEIKSVNLKMTAEDQHDLKDKASLEISPQIDDSQTLMSLAQLEKASDAPFDPADPFYAFEKVEASELFEEAPNVFAQNSLIDFFDSSDLASQTKSAVESIGLKEPTLPSSEHTLIDDQTNENVQKVIASSSDFIAHLDYAPKQNGDGFLFKLSLRPKPHKFFKRIHQNIYFLIDRSHSIPSKDYLAAKEAVSKALDCLHPEDHFNILVFDDKVSRLSPKNLVCSAKNLKLARQFLKNQKHGGFFATTDLYTSLDKIVPAVVKEDEVHTAILISDGDTYLSKQKQRKTLHHWSQKNKGKISLFSVAIGKNRNLALLDVLSTFNKGSIRSAHHKEVIDKELLTLTQSLHSPIGKDLSVTALAHNSGANLKIYPQDTRLPNLYENLEYVLYGSIDQASDFTLFLQGRYYDHWLDIKKSISLSKGTLIDCELLEKGVLLQKAYGQYEQYLLSGHPEFLQQAKSILEPIGIPLAFE